MTLAQDIPQSRSNGSGTASNASGNVSGGDLREILDRMRAAARKRGVPDYDTRIEHLNKLERALLAKKHDIANAISRDFGHRAKQETLAIEVMFVINELKHVRAHLHEWMETEPRSVSWLFFPGRAEVIMQPVGVVGVVSPWNYPVQLSLTPLINALAAGNRVLIKPSELVPETAELLKALIAETFEADHVTVVTGGVEVAESFSRLPFDHLVFTGSTRLGKVVMKAAAENLVPVTLELGGKSPAIVGEGYSIETAAQRIIFGKCLNAGQTCIAPDYAIVPKAQVAAFAEACRRTVAKMYPRLGDNPDYSAVVNEAHYRRLQGYLTDAREKGANIVELKSESESIDEASHKLAPTIVLDTKDDMTLMQEEIFGPILPIVGYSSLEEAINYVNDRPRPLALYYFDDDQTRIDRVLEETISGGVTINDVALHFAQPDLPFGGSGASGMGAYHGREGFETFTKKKPVFYQSRINGSGMLRPPFGGAVEFLLKALLGK